MTDYNLYATRLPALSTLPVTWLEFSGIIQGSAVQLTWETSNEINNTGFTIQRSPDGILFDSIGFRPASSVVQDRNVYTFSDMHPLTGVNYYRIQQEDFDGKILFSKTVRLNFNLANLLSIYPNPASKHITLRGTSAGSNISLYGMDGRKYREVRSSGGYVTIDINDLPKGIYIVRVISSQINLQSPTIIVARLVKL
jgi:trimeric autotransporter adhesin